MRRDFWVLAKATLSGAWLAAALECFVAGRFEGFGSMIVSGLSRMIEKAVSVWDYVWD